MEFCTGQFFFFFFFFFFKEQLLGKYNSSASKESTWNDMKHTELNNLFSDLKNVKIVDDVWQWNYFCFTLKNSSLFLRVI